LLLDVSVAIQAHLSSRSFLQNHLSVLRFFVAGLTPHLKGPVDKVVHQLGSVGPVWVVALGATAAGKRLTEVRLPQSPILAVVAVEAKSRLRFSQMENPFIGFLGFAFVGRVAAGAT
jgi:hypothetical protein